MQKRVSILLITLIFMSVFFACSPINKMEYDDVLIPIEEDSSPLESSASENEMSQDIPSGDMADDSAKTDETETKDENDVDKAESVNSDETGPAEETGNTTEDKDIPDGEETNPDDEDNQTDASDADGIEEVKEDTLALLPADGFSYDLTSGIIYDPQVTYTAEDIEALYASEDRFAPFKALAGKKIDDMTDDEFAVLAPTSRMSFEELVGDSGVYNGYPKAFPFAGTYKLEVDLSHQIVTAYIRDAAGEYTIPIRYMRCSSGGSGSNSPDGLFKMRDYRVRYALFRSANCYAQYWSLIVGRIYFHSILYSSLDASTYTETSYNNLGTAVSHGCIRLSVPDARWIWYHIAPETECKILYGTDEDTEIIAVNNRLKLADLPEKRPALKMGEIPWTDNWTVEDVPQEQPFVNGSQD